MAEVALLKQSVHAPVYVHKGDAENLETPGADKLPLHFPVTGVKADGFLTDGQEMSVGNLKIQVIHTPGHTPGGVCFYLPKEKVLISGDTLFRGTIGNVSFPTARADLMWVSLKKLAALPQDVKVYPGHGGPTQPSRARDPPRPETALWPARRHLHGAENDSGRGGAVSGMRHAFCFKRPLAKSAWKIQDGTKRLVCSRRRPRGISAAFATQPVARCCRTTGGSGIIIAKTGNPSQSQNHPIAARAVRRTL